jgi:endoglucanase
MNRLILIVILIVLNLPLLKAQTPWLHVSGNKILDPAGNTVILRGVAIQDIGGQKLDPTVGLNGLIDKLTNTADAEAGVPGWYTKIIRFTISPPVGDLQTYYDNTLKPAVDYATSKGLYVIIDNHYIATIDANSFDYTNQFWAFMAPRFKTYPNVLYEVYNEPINSSTSWTNFKKLYMQPWVNLIRKYAPHNLILAGNQNWDQTVGTASASPLVGNNIVYVAHIYPGQYSNANIKSQVETAAANVPVFLSEWGFSMTSSSTLLQGTVTNYGTPIMDWAESLGLNWTAWCADNDWEPTMFTSNWVLKTGGNEMGQFVKQKLYDKRNLNQPANIACLPPFLGPDQTICSAVPITITTGYTATGKTFTWYKDNVLLPGETGPSLSTATTKGNYKVTLDSNSCSMSDDINVVDTLFKVSLIPDAVLTDSIVLVAGDPAAGYTYEWLHNGNVIAGAVADSLKVFDTCKTTYTVNVSYPGCGMQSDSFKVLCAWGYFLGHPFPVPGIIQAEDYNIGNVPNISFYDTDLGNNGGAYRNDAVDIETCADGVNQYDVGWTETGEWLKYSINVTDPGTSAIVLRVASNNAAGGSLRIEAIGSTGTRSSGSITIPYTGGWQQWTWVIFNSLDFLQTDTMMRMYIEAGGFNVNYIEIRKGVIVAGVNAKRPSGSTLAIYPNPASDFIRFSEGQDKYDWKIYNTLGEEMLHGSGDQADLSSLLRGPYILMIGGEAYKILKW